MKRLNELTGEAYAASQSKGFWDDDKDHPKAERLMLIISELGEAMEAHRKGKFADITLHDDAIAKVSDEDEKKPEARSFYFKEYIKDTFEDEIADALIRMCDFCGGYEIPLKYDDEMRIAMAAVNLRDNIGEQLLDMCEVIVFLNGNLDRRTFESEFCMRFVAMILAFCEKQKIDIDKHVELKMKYNATRERLHGKKY